MQTFNQNLMLEKRIIRKAMREKNRSLSPESREESSLRLWERVSKREEFQSAECIALFCSLPDEPDTTTILKMASSSKRVVIPRVEGEEMSFYDYIPDSLESGSYGILEPKTGDKAAPEEIDLMIVPGVAFTLSGKRMGRGKGYYDKYMAKMSPKSIKIGVCYAHQIMEELPTEPHDIMMQCVIFG